MKSLVNSRLAANSQAPKLTETHSRTDTGKGDRSSSQTYSEHFVNFRVAVSQKSGRIRVTFREKDGNAFASLTLPPSKAKQLGYGLLMACAGDINPLEFDVDDSIKVSTATAA